jgi:hypothetical protein
MVMKALFSSTDVPQTPMMERAPFILKYRLFDPDEGSSVTSVASEPTNPAYNLFRSSITIAINI